MNGLLERNSSEHIAEVAEIEMYYNDEEAKALKAFKKAHPGIEPLESPVWVAMHEEIEGRRMTEFRALCERVIDPPSR